MRAERKFHEQCVESSEVGVEFYSLLVAFHILLFPVINSLTRMEVLSGYGSKYDNGMIPPAERWPSGLRRSPGKRMCG